LLFRDNFEIFVHVEGALVVFKRIIVVKGLFDKSSEVLSTELLLR